MKSLKIVHCSTFVDMRNGYVFYSMDRKITHGMIQNKHMVYNFSFRDNEKNSRFLGIKGTGLKKMNQNLIDTCLNISPDILLLGKAELIDIETIKEIRRILPEIKIVQWFVDFLATEKAGFFERFNYIDAFFQTTVDRLELLSVDYKKTVFSYLPNISDKAFDKKLDLEKEYDIIYIARDYKEDVRTKFAKLLDEFCKKENINLKMYGSLGNPAVFGDNYHKEISKAKIAINFNREDKLFTLNNKKILGSSDRMNHFMGCGICTFSPRILDMDKLYEDNKDIIYFDNVTDCFKKIKYFLEDKRYEIIAESGYKKSIAVSNAKRVTKFMLEVVFKNELSENYEWKNYIFSSKGIV